MNYSSGVLFADVRIRYSSDCTEPVESIVDPQLLTEFISARASQRLQRKQLENTSMISARWFIDDFFFLLVLSSRIIRKHREDCFTRASLRNVRSDYYPKRGASYGQRFDAQRA